MPHEKAQCLYLAIFVRPVVAAWQARMSRTVYRFRPALHCVKKSTPAARRHAWPGLIRRIQARAALDVPENREAPSAMAASLA
jgi:hypothetical protein